MDDNLYLEEFKKKLRAYADAVALAGYINGWDDGYNDTVQGSYSQEGCISIPILRDHVNKNKNVRKAYNDLIESFATYVAEIKMLQYLDGLEDSWWDGYFGAEKEDKDER